MKHILFSAFVCLGLASILAAAPPVVFERDIAIWTVGLDGKGAKKLVNGSLPQISPDGTQVAFNTISEDEKSFDRHIAIADIATGKITVLKQTPSSNCFGPAWSPDGKHLLFSIFMDDNWNLGVINVDGTGFAIAKKAEGVSNSYYAPAWAGDGQSFFCHDLDAIYHCDFAGQTLKTWKIEPTLKDCSMNSGNRLSVSPDGKRLLMGADGNEEHQRENWEGPPPALWVLDLATDKAARLSKPGHFAWDPDWIDDHEIVFISQGPKEDTPSIYRRSLAEDKATLVIKDGRTPSASTVKGKE